MRRLARSMFRPDLAGPRDFSRCKYRAALPAAVGGRRDPGRRRVCRWPRLCVRRRARCDYAHAGFVLSFLSANRTGVANWSSGHDPDRSAVAASSISWQGSAAMRTTLAIRDTPWLWSVAGALLVGVVTSVALGFGTAANMLSAASAFVVFTVLVGLGQMLVVTSGP